MSMLGIMSLSALGDLAMLVSILRKGTLEILSIGGAFA
jgi:hypothetical protein